MNWGKATVLILAVFVGYIGWMSYVMFRVPNDDYDHQYYEDGLNFDHDYNREKQVVEDHAQPKIGFSGDSLKITFTRLVNGKVTFMRPSSDAPDTAFNLRGTTVTILTKNLAKGNWQLVLDWKSDNKAYLYNQEVYIK